MQPTFFTCVSARYARGLGLKTEEVRLCEKFNACDITMLLVVFWSGYVMLFTNPYNISGSTNDQSIQSLVGNESYQVLLGKEEISASDWFPYIETYGIEFPPYHYYECRPATAGCQLRDLDTRILCLALISTAI